MARIELVNQILSVSNKARIATFLTTDKDRWNVKGKEAMNRSAVLVPICSYRGKLSLLFTIRNVNLSSHKGQVSFPGGHESPGDEYPIGTAIRETREEIGLCINREDVIACIGPVPNRKLVKNIAAVIADIGEVNEDSLTLNTNEGDPDTSGV
ncbi:Nucleoside diphosphate-linked moiety X motif 8, mitochondrial [Oopsacas minuta]|uniref:Nucleoside diphosphate-linked moiety X motif 8, mitochondrial n=1 Tax=Oopsacas minuta TaxID=111878 RepID=A0AAV7JWW7_9METZ|nr:Nucleoside diphosphate-linked moiety X motif 8, mitochondrial [Oopsacas minuta]